MGHKGGGKSTTVTKSEPWAPAQAQLKDVLAQAKQEYEKNGGLSGNWIDRNYPDFTPEMKQSLQNLAQSGQLTDIADQMKSISSGGAGNIAAAQQGLQDQLAGKYDVTAEKVNNLSSQLYDSDLVKSQKQQLQQDLAEQYQEGVYNLNQSATLSGNMGSSRSGVAQGVMFGKGQTAYAKGAADIENSARQTSMNYAMNMLQQNNATRTNAIGALGSLGMQQAQLGATAANLYQQGLQNQYTAAQAQQQQAINQAQNQWFNQQGASQAGWTNLARYQSVVAGIGGMGGQSTSTATAPSSGGGLFNQVLGGASTVAGMGQSFGWWGGSDATLKGKVRLKGRTKSGDKDYDWEWNARGRKLGLKGKGEGVLAQVVAKDKPEAVAKGKSGALMVNYDKTSVKPKNTKKI